MRLNIRSQLILGLLPGLLFLLLVAGVGYFNTRTLDKAHHQLVEASYEMDTIKDLQLAVQQALMPPNDALIRGPNPDEAALFETLADEVDRRFATASPAFGEPEELELLGSAQADWETVKATGFSLVNPSTSLASSLGTSPTAELAASEAEQNGTSDAVRMEQMDAAAEEVTTHLEQLHHLVHAELDSSITSTESTHRAAERLLFLGTALAIAGGALFALLFSQSLTRPIRALRDGAEALGAGRLDVTIPDHRADEVGDLGRAFNRMAGHLAEARANLEQKVTERTRALATINVVAEAASQSLDLPTILTQALDKVLEVMDVTAAEVFLLDEEQGELTLAAHRGELGDSFREITRFGLGEGFPGRVAQTGETLITDRLAEDMRYLRRQVVEAGIGSFACVPLRAKGNVVGTIDVAAHGARSFTPEEITLLENIGHQLGLAVENAHLFRAEKTQRELAETLRRAAREMSSLLEPDAVYQAVLTRASQVLDCDLACLLTLDGGELEIAALYGQSDMRALEGYRFTPQTSPTLAQVIETRQAHTFCEPGRKTPFDPQSERFEEIEWCLVVPLLRGQRVLGLLALEQRGHCYETQEEAQIAWTFANHAAVALENARLYAQVKTFNQELEGRVQARTAELAEARDLLARQADELRHVLRKTVRVQAAERKRIAQEVHDGLTQWVMGALFELQAARVCLPERPIEASEKLQVAQDVLKNIKVEMRRLIYDLRPPLLDTGGLLPAVESLAVNWQQVSGLRCRVVCRGTPATLPPETELTVYRIIQEALNNVEKHAQARQASISFQFEAEQLSVCVSDDGVGFDVQAIPADGQRAHIGLAGMRERAASIHGTLAVSSIPGQGARVNLCIPLAAARSTLEAELAPLGGVYAEGSQSAQDRSA